MTSGPTVHVFCRTSIHLSQLSGLTPSPRLQVNGTWGLSEFVCDLYIASDVTGSTCSIFNLVAISIDR